MLCAACIQKKAMEENTVQSSKNSTPRTCLCCNLPLCPTKELRLYCENCSEERWICEVCGATFRLSDLLYQEEWKDVYLAPSLGKHEERKVIAFLLQQKKQGSEPHE